MWRANSSSFTSSSSIKKLGSGEAVMVNVGGKLILR